MEPSNTIDDPMLELVFSDNVKNINVKILKPVSTIIYTNVKNQLIRGFVKEVICGILVYVIMNVIKCMKLTTV